MLCENGASSPFITPLITFSPAPASGGGIFPCFDCRGNLRVKLTSQRLELSLRTEPSGNEVIFRERMF
jgi:hypothetical protein